MSVVNFNDFNSLLDRISFQYEIAILTEETSQEIGKKYGVVCNLCRSTFVVSLLKIFILIRMMCLGSEQRNEDSLSTLSPSKVIAMAEETFRTNSGDKR